jgi:phenylacetate-CoA ligase
MKLLRYLPRFQRAYRELGRLAEREMWSRAQIEAWQLERLNAVWRHAMQHVPYYRHLARERKLPRQFESLPQYRSDVPLLPKAAIREQPTRLLSEQASRGFWKRTSGSTMSPMSCYWAKEAHLEMLRAKYRFQAMWGVDVLDRIAVLWGQSGSFQPGWKGRLARWRQPVEDRLRGRLRLPAYHLRREELREYLRRVAAFRPAMLYGYSLAMVLLAEEAAATGFRCDALKAFVMTSEAVLPRYVEVAEKALGVPALTEYGAVECGFLAGEWRDRTLRVREDMVLLETLPLDDGRYEIVVSVLNNPSFPLLRYPIGDATDAPLETPPHGFAWLRNLAGRTEDLLVTRTGAYLHWTHLEALFKYQAQSVRRYHVRQHRDGRLTVHVELNDGAHFDAAVLRQTISELVEGFPVQVEIVDELPPTRAGKHRAIVSEHEVAPQRIDLASPPRACHRRDCRTAAAAVNERELPLRRVAP